MKTILRYLFLATCLSSYCFFVFSSSYVASGGSEYSNINHSEKIHLSELSKIVFPQSTNTEGNNFSFVQIELDRELASNKIFITTQYLCKLVRQFDVNYLRESKSLVLQFPISDIIFPFHNFW